MYDERPSRYKEQRRAIRYMYWTVFAFAVLCIAGFIWLMTN